MLTNFPRRRHAAGWVGSRLGSLRLCNAARPRPGLNRFPLAYRVIRLHRPDHRVDAAPLECVHRRGLSPADMTRPRFSLVPILRTSPEPYPAHPTRAMPEPTAWRDPPDRAPQRATPRRPRGRTSRAELPARGPVRLRRERIARGQCPPAPRPYGPGQGGRSKDATDKAPCGRRSYGRSRARLYKAIRPHSSLGYRPPAPETVVLPSWPRGFATLRWPASLAEKPAMH